MSYDEFSILARGPKEPPDSLECPCGLMDGCPECNADLDWEDAPDSYDLPWPDGKEDMP
jgi:hypothetical protein